MVTFFPASPLLLGYIARNQYEMVTKSNSSLEPLSSSSSDLV